MLYGAIQAVRDAGHEIVAISTAEASPEYRVNEHDFRQLAEEIGCAFSMGLTDVQADVAISVNWPVLIPETVRQRFPHGILNAHAGDLPRYRGNACPNWAILNGETEVVFTIHEMAEELDAGPVLLKRPFPLTDRTYIGDVYVAMEKEFPDMFVTVLRGLEANRLRPVPQTSAPLRCFPRVPSDSRIDWTRPAVHLDRLVRASAEPFAGAYTFYNGTRLRVWRARASRLDYEYLGIPGQVAARDAEGVTVLTGDGVLILEQVELEGESGRVPAAECIRSLRTRLGLDLER
jgi:UDP-4-amino-4-deoxy-L-arabinose formyltransferase/UDP-glucuronic acid dehydrogenase (UDP-4-keto-hexauronic acid decarboxylating)